MTRRDALPDLGAALDLGLAWQVAEAALPSKESVIEGVSWMKGKDGQLKGRPVPDVWTARAYRWDVDRPWHRVYTDGATPAEALRNLAAKLREARP